MDYPDNLSLHSAAESNDLEAAELLLEEKIDIYRKDEQGLTPLHILVKKRIELFDSLYVKENDEYSSHVISPKESKALEEADAKQEVYPKAHMYKYREIDQEHRARFNKKKEDSLNAMHKKIEQNGRFINMILKHKGVIRRCTADLKLLNFHAACTLKNCATAENLLDKISNVNQSVSENSSIWPGYTALHFAMSCRNIETMKMLISKGANLQICDAVGVTPIDICPKVFGVEEMQSILSLVPAWKNVLFSNGKTKLMDYLSSLQDPDSHAKFLQSMGKDVGISLQKNSPLWPGWRILHIATTSLKEPQRDMINNILTQGADVTAQDIHGSSPLHLAFRQNKLKVVELLLKHHKKAVNPLDANNLSHLHIAASVNRQPLVNKLLKNEENFDVAYTGQPLPTVKVGWTPLHTAVHTRHVVVAKKLLENGSDFLQTDARGFNVIHMLLGSVHTKKVADIVFASDRLKECVVENVGLTHLHSAVWINDPKAIEWLLDLGSDIEATIGKLEDEEMRKFEGCRPIHVAMLDRYRHSALEVLLRRGADILAKKLDGTSPLSEVLTGKLDMSYLEPIVELIWSSKKWQQRIKRELGMTMLHLVCYAMDKEKIEELLGKRIDVNARMRDDSDFWPGFTPLHVLVATSLNHLDKIKQDEVDNLCGLLLEKGADVTLFNAQGDTPVIMALMKARQAEFGNAHAGFLMKHHRDFSINPASKPNMSHFHVACLLNEVETAEKFLQHSDVDVNQQISSADDSGRFAGHTPLLLALSSRAKKYYDAECQIEMTNLLIEHGADVHAVDAFGYTALHKLAACTARNVLFPKILADNEDVNKRANDGKTPMEILLSNGAAVGEIKYLVERGARMNAYNPVSGVGYMAIVLTSSKYKNSADTEKILQTMMGLPDVVEVSDNGRNAIHNAVATSTEGLYSSSYGDTEYGKVIEKLERLGCDVFHQDSRGRTALHLAVEIHNQKAVEALLECGAADVNVVDSTGKSPFSYTSEFRKDKRAWRSTDTNFYYRRILAVHLRKLQIVGLQVSDLNARLLRAALKEMNDCIVNPEEEALLNWQLIRAFNIKMCERGFTLRDFLYETGPVTCLRPADRDAVDLFFKRATCLDNFSELKSLLKLQYKNVRQRPSLIGPAVIGLRELLGFPLPDVCAEIVLTYLTNADLKSLILLS